MGLPRNERLLLRGFGARLFPSSAPPGRGPELGAEFATVLYFEGLFRHFENRRQLAAYAGLAPSPWKSGGIDHEQGISKAGNLSLAFVLVLH
jgi:transposase